MQNVLNLWTNHASNSPTRGRVIKFSTDRFVIGREKRDNSLSSAKPKAGGSSKPAPRPHG
jgi:hypothetical protein